MGGNTQMLNPSNVEIMSAWNFRCIDQTGWSTANGIVMQIYGCTGWSNQRWNFNSDKSISIGNGGSCLDLQNGVIGNGTPIQQWTCYSGSKNQQWIYSSSDLTIRLAANTNYCLDINNSLSGANGSKLQIWSCTGGSNQKWYLVQ